MVPEIWSVTDRIFLILDYILPFHPTNSPKIKIKKSNEKECLDISSFYTSVPKIMIISYTVPEIWHVTDVILFFIFGYLLPFYPLPSYQPKKIKIQKKNKLKNPGDIITLHMYPKKYHQMYSS